MSAHPRHMHGEAFKVMTYRADDGEEELIWNSRDGVTPFVVTLRSGQMAKHVDWQRDRYAPSYVPPIGSRVFVDLTPERALEAARANAARFWDDPKYPARLGGWPTQEALARELANDYFGDGHAPDLVEVTEDLLAQAAETGRPFILRYPTVPAGPDRFA